jgi:hypothetical protein
MISLLRVTGEEVTSLAPYTQRRYTKEVASMRRTKAVLAIAAAVGTMVTMSAPVMAQDFGQEFSERRISSGAASPTTTVNNSGDNVNLAPASQQTVNTGNVLNEQGVVTTDSTGFTTPFVVDGLGFVDGGFFGFDGINGNGDIDFLGSTIDIGPSLTSAPTQTIEQSTAA